MKTLVFDMYGVIIKESKGNFIPYTYSHFGKAEQERLTRQFRTEKLFTKAGNGALRSDEFLSQLGYPNPVFTMQDYLENNLSLDTEFYAFADNFLPKYQFALLSNDVSEWSRHLTQFYNLNQYFTMKIISGDVHCRKPDEQIFHILLEKLAVPAGDCIFIDNSVKNLQTAEQLGMETILFNRDNEQYNGKKVYSFQELALIL